VKECHKKIQNGKDPCKVIKGSEMSTEGFKQSAMSAVSPGGVPSEVREKRQETPEFDLMNIGLLKSYYYMRLLRMRDVKIKLLSVVNYFRAVQRILSLELKSFITRERA
jgi:hypothetical protein